MPVTIVNKRKTYLKPYPVWQFACNPIGYKARLLKVLQTSADIKKLHQSNLHYAKWYKSNVTEAILLFSVMLVNLHNVDTREHKIVRSVNFERILSYELEAWHTNGCSIGLCRPTAYVISINIIPFCCLIKNILLLYKCTNSKNTYAKGKAIRCINFGKSNIWKTVRQITNWLWLQPKLNVALHTCISIT